MIFTTDRSRDTIDSRIDLERAAVKWGLLPFFTNPIRGLSVEEMTAPGLLFGGSRGEEGCWEWKGPVIQEQTAAYGKFFRRKAGFVSRELLPDFLNYRRAAYPVQTDSPEAMILKLVKEREALTSAEMREFIFGRPAGKRRSDEPVDSTVFVRPPRQCLEGALQRLQMGGRLLIADFQYKYTRKGERYGWGVALYSTPEIWFEQPAFPVPRSAEESFSLLVDYLGERLPDISRPVIEKLLK